MTAPDTAACEKCAAPLPGKYLGTPWAQKWMLCPACMVPPSEMTAEEALHDVVVAAARNWASGDTVLVSLTLGHLRALVAHIDAQAATIDALTGALRDSVAAIEDIDEIIELSWLDWHERFQMVLETANAALAKIGGAE